MLLLALACTPITTVPVDVLDSGPAVTDTGDGGPVGDPALLCQVSLTCGSPVLDEPKVPCDLRIESGDGVVMHDARAMVEKRGRSSLEFPKPQYAVELHREVELLSWFANPWSYRDTGEPPPEGWTLPGFDASAWPTGVAPLGYGGSEATAVGYGGDAGDKHPSTWFRRTFTADPAGVAELTVGLMRDDAAVVWLNGTEVVRSNLAADAGPEAFAETTVQDEFETAWHAFAVDPGLLVAGENVLAVEVHQAAADSSDLAFDLYLQASDGRLSTDFFGFGGEDDWILNGVYVDRLLWRNKLAYDLFQGFGGKDRWAAEQAFCELTLDGAYMGVYLLGETARRDADRIDIAEDPGDGSSFIVKLDDEGGFRASGVSYGEWRAVYPEDEGAWEGIDAALDAWEHAVLAGDEAQWDTLDLDSAVDWALLEEFTKNNDAYFLSVHLWRDAGGPVRFAPWDFDLTLGYPYYDCGWEGWIDGREAYVDVWAASPAFGARLADRWVELRAGPMADEAVLARIAAYEATMGEAIARNFERWPVDEIAFSWGGVENWLCPSASWEEEHARVMAWIPERLAWMDANVAGFGTAAE